VDPIARDQRADADCGCKRQPSARSVREIEIIAQEVFRLMLADSQIANANAPGNTPGFAPSGREDTS